MKSMDAREFVHLLNQPRKPTHDAFVVGMAKPSEDDYDSFLLGPTHKCGPWTEIPIASVARVVPLDMGDCGTHRHPIVAVYFHERENPTVSALAHLLRRAQNEAVAGLVRNGGAGTGIMALHTEDVDPGTTTPSDFLFCIFLPWAKCWEKNWQDDFPPGSVPPPAQPSPQYECAIYIRKHCLL